MSMKTTSAFLQGLLSATKPSEVRALLAQIGDSADHDVDQPFGPLNLQWHFYGDTDSNISTIGMASKPIRSLVERITNAIDAVLEKQKEKRPSTNPKSPQGAAKDWFGRPPSDTESGIYSWNNYQQNGYDRLVHVVMNSGDKENSPTIDVKDKGIGLLATQFKNTILSLQGGNKIKKPYLSGAFGQGGSTTLAFCEYTLIASRHHGRPDKVSFTVIKELPLPEPYDYNAYAYLAVETEDGLSVPECEWDDTFQLYKVPEEKWNDSIFAFEHGTVVRHYGFRLEGYTSTLSPSPGNLYHVLHYMMFDPLLPFRIVDFREEVSLKDELVTGSRNRLMKGLSKQIEKDKENNPLETGTEVRHYAPREMVSPLGESEPCVGLEYWVPINYRTYKKKIGVRNSSSDIFIDRYHPIIGTLNGQNHGEETAKIIRELDMRMLAKHVIVHIDATHATKDVRNGLFASTREGFKDDVVLREILRVLKNRMEEDEVLYEIEKELLERILDKESEDVDEEVKQEITKLLKDQGFDVSKKTTMAAAGPNGQDETDMEPERDKKKPWKPEPLPTLDYPEVTFVRIAFPKHKLEIPLNRTYKVRIETDANFRFDRENKVALRSDPSRLRIASNSKLEDGHKYWRVRATDDATVGNNGEIIVAITKPDGSQVEARVDYEIMPKQKATAEKQTVNIPDFKIQRIDPYKRPELFEQIWDDVKKQDIEKVAYKATKTSDGVLVSYSSAFGPYREQMDRLKKQVNLAERFKKNYEIWIGYHAILQLQEGSKIAADIDVEDEKLDRIQERERALVAVMQATQAIKTAELQKSAAAAEASSD